MLQKIARFFGADANERALKSFVEKLEKINRLEAQYEALSDEALRGLTDDFRRRLAQACEGLEDEKERQRVEQETLDALLPEAFAAVREASKRTLGMRHYDVQMIGGMALHSGKIAEMRTGEGKTLVATLPLYLNALTGRGVHLVTVNDYLARRDARWMSPIYHALGMQVGVLQMAGRTENGKKAFLVDPTRISSFEDQHNLRLVDRAEAYAADITYGTNSEYGFDYLRDNLVMRIEERVQRGHFYAIVDEVDNILIDEARTPLIISGPAADDAEWYVRMAQVVKQLRPEDYEVSEKDHQVTLTEVGEAHVEDLLGVELRDPERPEDITPEQARILGYLEQALRAQHLYRKNKEYIVQAGRVVIVDEFTGRLMPGRRWSEGLHQAVEAKEGVRVEPDNVTYATITLQNYFRMYQKLAGMTGTAATEAEEFGKIYKLDVLPIPTNLEFRVSRSDSELVAVDSRDEQGYKVTYYARRDDPQKRPLFWKRKDYPDLVYRTEEAKQRAITTEIVRLNAMGRPQLVGTTSVEHSERLSSRMSAELVRRLMQTLLIRQAWLKKHDRAAAEVAIPELALLNQPLEKLNVADLRPLARQAELASLNPEEETNMQMLLELLQLDAVYAPRLIKILQGGVQHQVLNARKHDEEALIILRAGAYGAVTIATNMAGRGVDIKLGGALPDEVHRDVNRVLRRNGIDPYGMTDEERYQALQQVSADAYGIYAEAVQAFLQHIQQMRQVRALGGLHVIGSERHEARRIDNQLRGRAARQGDPGSSRFYLSLEDDLMRLFGGAQVEALMKRLKIDESMPIESGIVGRVVEQSQHSVEGRNFDIRKHTLEYDDVLNMQRKRIFAQRDRVFTKEDLFEDVAEMLRAELQTRVAQEAKAEEGPWRLLAYLEEIQPPIQTQGVFYPTYTQRLLMQELRAALPERPEPADLYQAFLQLTERVLHAEREHVLRTVQDLLERAEESFDAQLAERLEMLDTFREGLKERAEAEEGPLRPQALLEELSGLVRTPLRLSPEQLRALPEGGAVALDAVRQQVQANLLGVALTRLSGTLLRRISDLDLRPSQLQNLEWADVADTVLRVVEAFYDRRAEQLLGKDGQIAHDLDPLFERLGNAVLDERNWMALLGVAAQGTQMDFDRRTHRRTWRRVARLNYVYLTAQLIGRREEQDLTREIIEHLEQAVQMQRRVWGILEWGRLTQNDVTLGQMEGSLLRQLAEQWGEETLQAHLGDRLNELPEGPRRDMILALGRRLQNEAHRELLLRVISQAWIDYLTQMEALRVQIGMESYAQRDPLVAYKSRASELFNDLLKEIRSGVVAAMMTYRPSRAAAASVERDLAAQDERPAPASPDRSTKKRKRH